MDYATHYDRLIARARGRVLAGYRERHHVLPRCMGGTDAPANLVDLTPEEHYVAHQLLVKMHTGVRGLAHAAVKMAKQCRGRKAYGWLRRAHARATTAQRLADWKGDDYRARQSERMKGNVLFAGRSHTTDAREKVAISKRGVKRGPLPASWRANLSAAVSGKKRGPLSVEHRAKLSTARIGNKNALGKSPSPETRAKIAAALCARAQRMREVSVG